MEWLVLVAALTSTAATAEPVYLSCQLAQESAKLPVEVSVDEANQRVTIALPSGRTVVRPALFSPTEVKVPDEDMTWIIGRTDLSFRRTFSFMPASDAGEIGTCAVKPAPPKRAF